MYSGAMSLEVSSDDVLALVENVEEWFLLDERGLRRRVARLRDRIRDLETENARLRAALASAGAERRETSDDHDPARPRAGSADPWAVPEERAARPPVVEEAEPRRSARFACRRCGELFDEANLRRVDGALVCASCDVPGETPPITGGSYR